MTRPILSPRRRSSVLEMCSDERDAQPLTAERLSGIVDDVLPAAVEALRNGCGDDGVVDD